MTATRPAPGRPLIADGGGASGHGAPRLAVADGNGGSPGRTSLVERGYVHARFGGVSVLVGPELAAQIRLERRRS